MLWRPTLGDAPAELIVFGGVASGAAPGEADHHNRALDPAIRLVKTYVRLIRARICICVYLK